MKSRWYAVVIVATGGICVAVVAGLAMYKRDRSNKLPLMTSSWPSSVYTTVSQDDFAEKLSGKLKQKLSKESSLAVMEDASERTTECIIRLQIEGVAGRDQVCAICYDQIKSVLSDSKAVVREFANSECPPRLEYEFVGIKGIISLTVDSGDGGATCIMRITEQRS